MKLRYQLALLAFVIAFTGGIIWSASHYHSKYRAEKARADAAERNERFANAKLTDLQDRQRDAAALDAKYTGELANAKATIDRLERDVSAGRRRLQVNAKCSVSQSAAAGSLGDAASPRLTDAAQRNYWRLRAGINAVNQQVGYLQDYIRHQCLK